MDHKSYLYYHEALELSRGEICLPRMAVIYPVYGCNLSCAGCLCNDYNTDKIFMDPEKFKDVTLQLKNFGVKSIEFCGGGEPLLHPDIKGMIRWVTDDLGLSLGVMTNGTLIDDELADLLAAVTNYVRVSLYKTSYSAAMNKIRKLAEAKERHSSDTIIGAKFLADPDNQDFVLKGVMENASSPGVNYISVKALRGGDRVFDYSDLEKKIRSIGSPKISADLSKSCLKGKCWMSPIHTLIDPLGDVYICCYYMRREREHCIGNVFEKPFAEIWGSTEHREKLKAIDPRMCNEFDCRWHKYNEEMSELLNNNTLHQFC